MTNFEPLFTVVYDNGEAPTGVTMRRKVRMVSAGSGWIRILDQHGDHHTIPFTMLVSLTKGD